MLLKVAMATVGLHGVLTRGTTRDGGRHGWIVYQSDTVIDAMWYDHVVTLKKHKATGLTYDDGPVAFGKCGMPWSYRPDSTLRAPIVTTARDIADVVQAWGAQHSMLAFFAALLLVGGAYRVFFTMGSLRLQSTDQNAAVQTAKAATKQANAQALRAERRADRRNAQCQELQQQLEACFTVPDWLIAAVGNAPDKSVHKHIYTFEHAVKNRKEKFVMGVAIHQLLSAHPAPGVRDAVVPFYWALVSDLTVGKRDPCGITWTGSGASIEWLTLTVEGRRAGVVRLWKILSELHDKANVTHGDIKKDNIVEHDGAWKFIDFDNSYASHYPLERDIEHHITFMAPENRWPCACKRNDELPARERFKPTDVFCLAVLSCELLSGEQNHDSYFDGMWSTSTPAMVAPCDPAKFGASVDAMINAIPANFDNFKAPLRQALLLQPSERASATMVLRGLGDSSALVRGGALALANATVENPLADMMQLLNTSGAFGGEGNLLGTLADMVETGQPLGEIMEKVGSMMQGALADDGGDGGGELAGILETIGAGLIGAPARHLPIVGAAAAAEPIDRPEQRHDVLIAGRVGMNALINGHYKLVPNQLFGGRPSFVRTGTGTTDLAVWWVPQTWQIGLLSEIGSTSAYASISSSALRPGLVQGTWRIGNGRTWEDDPLIRATDVATAELDPQSEQ
jgi:hypothetical protein